MKVDSSPIISILSSCKIQQYQAPILCVRGPYALVLIPMPEGRYNVCDIQNLT